MLVTDKNFAAIKEKCKSTTHDPSDCMEAAQKAQEAYINYYDMMAVILTNSHGQAHGVPAYQG